MSRPQAIPNRDHVPGYLYVFLRREDGAIKIGFSKNPAMRIVEVRSWKANGRVDFVAQVWTPCMRCSEFKAHSAVDSRRLPKSPFTQNEWFEISKQFAVEVIQVAARETEKHVGA
jgi:hypothetical protein